MASAAGITLLGVLSMASWSARGGNQAGGDGLFSFLSGVLWLVCLGSGVFLTADCLSREKRDGTLGLLFLTDLKGADIVLGKLASTSLMTTLMVIGALPVLAVCVLMGGVTGGELVRVSVALLLTMLFSLSVGMLVSVFLRDSSQTGPVTMLLLLMATGGPAVIGGMISRWPGSGFESLGLVRLISPAFLLTRTNELLSSVTQFLASAATIFIAAVVMLAIASVYVRFTWQDRPRRQVSVRQPGTPTRTDRSTFRGSRRPILDHSPVLWLIGEGVAHGRWLVVVVVALIIGVWLGFRRMTPELLQALPVLSSYVLPPILGLAIASTAAQFLVQMRQRGAFEFLLATPLSDADILHGLWLALRMRFLLTALVLVALVWIPGTTFGELPSMQGFPWAEVQEFTSRLYVSAKSIMLWLASGWVGLYFGLTTRRSQFAGLLAGFFGVFLPWAVWCMPEILSSLIALTVTRDQLRGRIRQTVLARLDAGQPV